MIALLDRLLHDGTLVDVALAAIVVELALLLVLARRGRTRMRPLDVVGHLLAGALLLLAVRSVVTGAHPLWTLALLAASFPAHLYDLRRRARSR